MPQAQDQQFTMTVRYYFLPMLTILAGASDIDGDELSIEKRAYTGADGVLVSIMRRHLYSFAITNENFNGDVQFSFDVSDGTGLTAAHIDVSVTPENDPPVAGSTVIQFKKMAKSRSVMNVISEPSSDVEGDVVSSSVTYAGDDGSFVDNGNGTYTTRQMKTLTERHLTRRYIRR
ncbi:cadherin-like domain-containing protein [Vibrio lentus]|nr:cadherin-like domain-containing protein [Vibrio lentus]